MITLKRISKSVMAMGMLFGLTMVGANAVDIKANLMFKGDLFRAEKDKTTKNVDYYYLTNDPIKQIDNPGDGLIFEMDNGIYGARLNLWYTTATASDENQWASYFRRSYAWFKPVDSVKVRVGYVGDDTFFKEKIDEWKVGSPFAINERDWDKHPRYVNCNDVEGWGFGLEYRPIDQLVFNAGITPGAKGHVASDKKEDTASIYNQEGDSKTYIAPWGVGAKYYWNDFEFQVSYRDGGMNKSTRDQTWSVIRAGVGYKNEHTYSFIQPILGLDYDKKDERMELDGMCIDLYSEYYYDALTLLVHAPVTFRWTGADTDMNYMELNVKAKYNLGSFGNLDDVSPYIQVGTNQDDDKWGKAYTCVWLLDKNFEDSFHLSYGAGVGFKVGAAELDVGVRYNTFSDFHKVTYKKDWDISVPFMFKIKNF